MCEEYRTLKRSAIASVLVALASVSAPGGINAASFEVRIMVNDNVTIERKSSAALGESFYGGICGEVGGCDDSGGDLIVSAGDDHYSYGGYFGTKGYVTTATSASDGYNNTDKLATAVNNGRGSKNPPGYTPNAALLCWTKTANGFSDWYLPARDELEQVYNNLNGVISFSDDYYWSSTEVSADDAIRISFNSGAIDTQHKGNTDAVRCVRRVN